MSLTDLGGIGQLKHELVKTNDRLDAVQLELAALHAAIVEELKVIQELLRESVTTR